MSVHHTCAHIPVPPGWGLRSRPYLDTQVSYEPLSKETSDQPAIAPDTAPRESTASLPPDRDGADHPHSHTTPPAQDAPPTSDPTPQKKIPLSKSFSFDQKYHIRWQLSRSLTTQHLLTMVSITNTLMNQSVGAHALASSSGVRKHRQSESEDSDWSDSEESQTLRDNQIRAVWSQV